MNYLSDNGGETYNSATCVPKSTLCFYRSRYTAWSNFEIANLDFLRGAVYTAFFDFLESRGGF